MKFIVSLLAALVLSLFSLQAEARFLTGAGLSAAASPTLSFSVLANGSPSSTINGSGSYTGPAPSGLTAAWNTTCTGTSTVTGFSAGGGTWAATFSTPASTCTGTLTATGTGSNTANGTSPSVTISSGGQVVNAVTVNFVPQGNYVSGSGSVGGTLYFTGGCTAGTQIGSLVATISGGGSYAGSWSLTGTNASSFTITGSAPGELKCNTTVAAGSYSFNAVAGTNSFAQAITAYAGQTYFISTSGSDANNGLSSGAPWLSINHAINCGDFIKMASGTYSASNFGTAGTVTCAGNDNVAWLEGAANFASLWNGGTNAVSIRSNYWGVQGVLAENQTNSCIKLSQAPGGATVHHLAVADSIEVGCAGSGIQTGQNSGTGNGNDYWTIIGNLAEGDSTASGPCFSGISAAGESNSDSSAGTHRYLALNIAWSNVNGANCNGTNNTTDGEGFILDRPDINSVTGTLVAESNLFLGNGSSAVEIFDLSNPSVGGTVMTVNYRWNTSYGDYTDPHHSGSQNWGINLNGTPNGTSLVVNVQHNISYEPTAKTGTGNNIYALGDKQLAPNATSSPPSVVDANWIAGNSSNQNAINFGTGSSGNLIACNDGTFVPNTATSNSTLCDGTTATTNPSFVSATIPGAPSCGSSADTIACMSTTIANFKPTASGASALGAINSSGTFGGNIACDANNSTDFIKNTERALPADMDPCG